MTPAELSPASSNTPGTEDNMSSFPEIEPPPGSCLGQNASTSWSCSNLQTIQKKLQIFYAEGLLPTIKVMLAGSAPATASSSHVDGVHLACVTICLPLNLLPSVRYLQESDLGLFHYLHDLLQSAKGTNIPRSLQLSEDGVLCQLSLQGSQWRVGLEQDPPPLSSQDEAAVCISFLRSSGHSDTTLPGCLLRFDSSLGVFVSTLCAYRTRKLVSMVSRENFKN